jgi:hypothetical protein
MTGKFWRDRPSLIQSGSFTFNFEGKSKIINSESIKDLSTRIEQSGLNSLYSYREDFIATIRYNYGAPMGQLF